MSASRRYAMLAGVRRHVLIGLVITASLALAVPAESRVEASFTAADHFLPRLANALEELEYAIDHERNAGDTLDEDGARADDYAAGEIEDAIDHLDQALADLVDAAAAGEISVAEAAAIARVIREARAHDRAALATIDGEGRVSDTLDDLADGLEDKEDAGDWIYYGDDYDWGDLGCTVNIALVLGDVLAGYDGCKVAVALLALQFGFPFTRFSSGFVGEANKLVAQFACTVLVWSLICRPPQPTMPPNQYIFARVGPTPTVMTDSWALAVGTNGMVQRTRFRVGAVQATDLAVRTTLRDLTPYGYVATDGSATAPRLGAGIGYVYQVKVENEDDGTALDAVVDIDLPTSFVVRRLDPSGCRQAGTRVRCQFGALAGGYAGLVSVWGEPKKTGVAPFRSVVTSGATEPSPDRNANSASTTAKVYGTPRTPISRIAAQVTNGRRGAFSGHATPGAAFEPALERVTKVEIAVLRDTTRAAAATPKPCLWLNRSGGFTKVPRHRGNCDKGVWLQAKGKASWTYVLRKGLPKGRYTVLARGTNAAGITTRSFGSALKNAVVFSVK